MNNNSGKNQIESEGLKEAARKESYLRAEVLQLRDEISSLRSSAEMKIGTIITKRFFFRLTRKIFFLIKSKIFFARRLEKSTKIPSPVDVDLIIPIYRNYDLVRNLLISLDFNTQKNIKNVFLVDDSDLSNSRNQLEAIIRDLNTNTGIFKIFINKSNLGYKSSVNSAWVHAKSEIVILLNSDIELPKDWLIRILRPFSDPEVALATPLATNSGANLTVDLAGKVNWREFDAQLSKLRPKFPDACTAIGYCLAVNRKILNDELIFSKEFIHGYGEDSDLHFRVIEMGKKSVVVDNLLIWHKSGASYATLVNADQLRIENAKKCHDKWGDKYLLDLAVWNKKKPLLFLDNFIRNYTSKNFNIDYLFVQLSSNNEIGGIFQLSQLRDEMTRLGSQVGSLYVHRDPSNQIDNADLFFSELEAKKIRAKKIIFSGIECYEFIKKFENFQNDKIINYLQGPDYLFPGNDVNLDLFIDSIRSVSAVMTQSPYLDSLAKYLGAKRREQITLGPKRSTFFDRGVTKKKILLVSTRKDPDKGLRFILPIFPAVQKQGWQIVGFGDLAQPELASHFDRHEGRITRERLAELFQSAALLLDTSIYEGLGLTSLEAGLCGVRSVVTRKGGIDSLAEFKDELIFIDDPLDLKAMTNQILNFDLTESESKRQKLVEKANHFSWESNIHKFIQSLDSF